VHVAGGNGKLIHVTAVARVLPRDWDGHRLLRFLAGLAMLALAFTAPAAPVTPVEPVAAVAVVEAANETSVTLSAPAPAPFSVRATAAPSLPEGLPVLAVAPLVALLVGLAQRARTTRGPPTH
jgi:hypothetical protein